MVSLRQVAAPSLDRMRLRRFVDGCAQPSAMVDRDGRCVIANARYLHITGRNEGNIEHSRLEDTVHPKDLPHARELLARVTQDHSIHEADLRICDVSGEYRLWGWKIYSDAGSALIVVEASLPGQSPMAPSTPF